MGLTTAIAQLQTGDFHDRWDAIKQLQALGDAALPDLLALVENDAIDGEVRWFAARSLGRFDRPEVVLALVQVLSQTDDDDLRESIAEALSRIGASAVTALTDLLSDDSQRGVVVQALASIHHGSTIDPLVTLSRDALAPVRATAIEALAKFSTPALVPVVVARLDDPSAVVRLAALRTLAGLKSQVSAQELVTWLTPRLWDIDLRVVKQAIHGLGQVDTETATTALLHLGQRPTTTDLLLTAVVQALGWQGTPQATEALIALWANASPTIRLELVKALTTVCQPPARHRASQQLMAWLQQLPTPATVTNPGNGLKRAMILGLGTLGSDTVIPYLQTLLQDPDAGIRLHAAAALRRLAEN